MSMTFATQFIELDLPLLPPNLVERVEAALQSRGTPLRWAITAVDRQQLTIHVEAVVTAMSSPAAGHEPI
jgi:hypothetical protein